MNRMSSWALVVAGAIAVGGCGSKSNSQMSSRDRAAGERARQGVGGEPDADMAAVLASHATLKPQPIESLPPAEARRQPSAADAVTQRLQEQGKAAPQPMPAVGRIETKAIPGSEGHSIPVRVYTPAGDGPFPVIVYFHGGGWVLATLDTYDASCRMLCEGAKAVVVSVDYRRAPEHKFPAAPEDAYASLQHVLNNAGLYNGDPARVAVAGESAGGNLATVACLMAGERGGKMPVHQLLVYPITDTNLETPSYRAHANAKPLNAAMMSWFFKQYLPNPNEPAGKFVAPLRASAEDLKALPPATLITAEIDPLRSEGAAYAERLRAAGVPVAHRDYTGVTHEFFGMGAVVDKAREANAFAVQQLKSAFAAAGK
jgi:acetyl esterase